MRIDSIGANDLASQYYYLEEMGLSHLFTTGTVDNNSGKRFLEENGNESQDVETMLGKLNVSQNKFFIIRLMQRGNITALLALLQKNQMILALNYFPREKLLLFLGRLPKEIILKMLLWVIPLKSLMQLFPPEVLFNILRSRRLEVRDLIKGFEDSPDDFLRLLLSGITDKKVDKLKRPEMMAMFFQLPKEQLLEGLKLMPEKDLFEYIFGVTKRDPELMMTIPRDQFIKVLNTMPKPNLVELFQLLPENMLVEFISQLPDQFLALSASQIDDKTFESVMLNQYQSLITALAKSA